MADQKAALSLLLRLRDSFYITQFHSRSRGSTVQLFRSSSAMAEQNSSVRYQEVGNRLPSHLNVANSQLLLSQHQPVTESKTANSAVICLRAGPMLSGMFYAFIKHNFFHCNCCTHIFIIYNLKAVQAIFIQQLISHSQRQLALLACTGVLCGVQT